MTPFAPARDFLHATLEGRFAGPRHWQTATLSLQWLAEGVLALAPLDATDTLDHVLLSTGIHGNETAPIEVVNSIVNDLLAGAMPLRCRLLVMLGNPVAMRSGARFTDYDMNRLFNGAHISQPQAQEARRAAGIGFVQIDHQRPAALARYRAIGFPIGAVRIEIIGVRLELLPFGIALALHGFPEFMRDAQQVVDPPLGPLGGALRPDIERPRLHQLVAQEEVGERFRMTGRHVLDDQSRGVESRQHAITSRQASGSTLAPISGLMRAKQHIRDGDKT